MNGFGFLNNIDLLRDVANKLESVDFVPPDDQLTDKDEEVLSKVSFRKLDEGHKPYKAIGASGNKPAEDDSDVPYAQFELGIGGGLKPNISKEMSRCEAFDGTTDESPVNNARNEREENVVEKVKNLFNDMYGKSYEKLVTGKPKIDHDFTKPNIVLDNTSMFKVKKGW